MISIEDHRAMTGLRLSVIGGVALALSLLLLPTRVVAQATPSDVPPGVGVLLPHAPVEPAEAAKALEKRTDIANAKLPTYPQAAKEAKRREVAPPGTTGTREATATTGVAPKAPPAPR